jgi:hypothetical protein
MTNHQDPKQKSYALEEFGYWNLEFGYCLEIEIWSLGFLDWDFRLVRVGK